MRKRVLILYTGGTFGMDADDSIDPKSPQAGRLKISKLSPRELKARFFDRVPELSTLAQCSVEVLFNQDSAHTGPREWLELAHSVMNASKKVDGIVILHGTDTLAYTASALSFLLGRTRVPVILTGAQKPLMGIRSDARRNLISAVEIASQGQMLLKKAGGNAELLKQVLVFFNDKLFQGNQVHKRSALDFDGFEAPFDSPIAVVGTKVSFMPRTHRHPQFLVLPKLDRIHFETQIGVIHLTPGFPAQAFSGELLHRLLGLILVTFPSGTAPTHEPDLLELVRRAKAAEVPVVLVAQGVAQAPGQVPSPTLYEAGRPLLSAGAHWSGGLTLECAYVKMAWVLGQVLAKPSHSRLDAFAKLWERRWSGEGSE